MKKKLTNSNKRPFLQNFILIICVLLFAFSACVSREIAEASYSGNGLTLDEAINEAALYFTGRISSGAKVALVSFDSPSGRLSDYVFEEMWRRFEDTNSFVMVDRRNLERIEAEIKHQYETGRVDEATVVSITRQYGAEILVHGQISILGNEYRVTVYATDVEKASSSQRAFMVRQDSRIAALLNASAEDEVERAVSSMAKAVSQKITIAIGRISYADTQSVSSLSAWLKNSIISGAHKQREKFQVATGNESADFAAESRGFTAETPADNSAIQAVVTGSYSPLDSGAEVSLQLISTSGNKVVLASERFVISVSEMQRRNLSLLPEKDNTVITKAEFDAKQQAVDPYAGRNNKWNFTVTPDVLDGIYYEGDFMSMRIFSARDCYFRITHVDVHGNTQVIYPTSARDNNFIHAGETRRIPDNTRYRMEPPFGEELILAAAYDQPFALNLQTVPLSADSITRNLTVESGSNTAISPSATAKFSYTILPRYATEY